MAPRNQLSRKECGGTGEGGGEGKGVVEVYLDHFYAFGGPGEC
jgi:hypothetical protein